MAKKRGGLGRGLESLFEDTAPSFESDNRIETLPLREIEPDPAQPRKTFDEETLAELAARGVAFTRATSAERALRHVTDMAWILDPSGNRHELSYGYVTDFARICSPTGTRFVTGELG